MCGIGFLIKIYNLRGIIGGDVMIKKLDIYEYGVYKNMIWNSSVGEGESKSFGHRNIIYGRNYSGKTTFSRIFRSLEIGESLEDFKEGKFLITLDDGREISNNDISAGNFNIRVYNSDFKKENLSFLYDDEEGEILPFTILGEKNVDIEKKIDGEKKKIEELKLKLYGSNNDGLVSQHNAEQKRITSMDKEIQKQLRESASSIRNNSFYFVANEKKKQYDIRDLLTEIPSASELNSSEEEKLRGILKEEIKPVLNPLNILDYGVANLIAEVNILLTQKIKPSKIIERLSNNNLLQQWVREGISLHKKEYNENCGFCGNPINDQLWNDLDSHFTTEVEEFSLKIENLIKRIEDKKNSLKDYSIDLKYSDFYSVFQEQFANTLEQFENVKSLIVEELVYLIENLNERRVKLFSWTGKTVNERELDESIHNSLFDINNLVESHNKFSNGFLFEQDQARRQLRFNEIYRVLKYTNYEKRVKVYNEENKKLQELSSRKEALFVEEQKSLTEIKKLEAMLKDEQNSVRLVNSYLSTFLGHPELYLELSRNSSTEKQSRFVIKRKQSLAKNLSEGEQSLISFCYFLASLKDITNVEDYTIFIDDPICSLDNNHIFYIYSLIDSEIASKKYKQVFISTHNLDFLKYTKKIINPEKNHKTKRKLYENRYWMIEKSFNKEKEVVGMITLMPRYLEKFSTEFIYLFHEIYRVANEEQNDNNYHVFYNFPNNARKFIETYMFFKYPDTQIGNDKKILTFFGENFEIRSFINRINNEYSHGEEQPDRLFKPVNIPEFKENAKIILKTISMKDPDQYDSFLKSIGANPQISEQTLEVAFS